ncbi:D-alanine--D-alanine ligase [Candidatus Desantisbacteria bacterium]|nr:D-alanine--D-alanine ligase [Candidatus Desantisbacteria bacterium]
MVKFNDKKKRKNNCVISFDADRTLPVKLLNEKNIKAVFIALHGQGGEDGSIQGMLEFLGIPYTGSEILASALAMNKIMAKKIFKSYGFPTPEYQVINKKNKKNKKILHYPIVVKPNAQGSACGVSIASNDKELNSAIFEAFKFNDEVLLEKYIPGRELTVGILGDKALPIIEIISKKKFYDYEAKYTPGKSKHIVPAKLSLELTKKLQNTALAVHTALGCRDYSRVDIRMDNDNNFYILEINTLPGMTNLSLLPDAAKSAGIDFPDLVEKIVKMANKRGNKDLNNGKKI